MNQLEAYNAIREKRDSLTPEEARQGLVLLGALVVLALEACEVPEATVAVDAPVLQEPGQ